MRDALDVDAVDSRAAFVAYVEALAADWRASERREAASPALPWGPAAGGWENVTVGTFLEALAAYARDAELPEQPDWRTLARLLWAGKAYE